MGETPDSDGSRRRRAFKPKTRTGCITCRIRRIKCDEEKPHCRKCTSTGRKCDGYTVEITARKSPSPKQSTPTISNEVSKPSVPEMAVIPFQGSKLEQRSFYYFQQETVPQISGFYRDQFWFQSVLQACHHNPAIRHAAIALGSLHENSIAAGLVHTEDLSAGGFALQQYNKAIQSLLHGQQAAAAGSLCKPHQRVDVALITCILFACFDALRGHLGSVFHHIDGGVKILSEIQTKDTTSTPFEDQSLSNSSLYAPMRTLNIMFSRLDIQGSSMLGSRRLGLVPTINRKAVAEEMNMRNEFNSFEEARDAQDSIYRCWHHDFTRTLTNTSEANILIPWLPREVDGKIVSAIPSNENLAILKAEYTELLEQWIDTYERFLIANPKNIGLPADHNLRLLQIFIFMHADIDHAATAESEMTWDRYTPQFSEMVTHARAVILSTTALTSRKTLFSLDTHLITPLYFVASRCRHPVVRRDAIACLFAANRQEGLWESRTIARVAQRVMELEEEGVEGVIVDGTEIPGWKRISDVQPVLDSNGRRAAIHYNRKPGGREGGLLTEVSEIMEW
ncbi:uncharacterized protein PAC_14368 [Phialocephala subalpina]|uniref:Zn(2)-C6 fungal-type domain-containing protein n=1 Tax=Phialocephala subalpina TaxID=576137 RepID=A0A1L7XHF5_9HELO|nr:uncharacterized protein PAC_14368 [Phialocephala subalpina]